MYTVLDFEFNQGFDYKDEPIEVNPACRFEIIQIGAVKLDKDFNILGSFSTYIKPQIYKRLHPYVSKITGINKADLEQAPLFEEAYNAFKQFVGESRIYCVWGNSDMRALYRNLSYYELIKGDILAEYIDVQMLTAQHLKYSRGKNIGLKNAMELLEIEIDIPFHDALSDAIYTAKALKAVYKPDTNIKIFNSKHVPKRIDTRYIKTKK